MTSNRAVPLGVQLVVNAALELGATVGDAPSELVGGLLNSESIIGLDELVVAERASRDLPPSSAAVILDGVPVLLGELGDEPNETSIKDVLRRYRNQATIARSWLGLDAQNLQLFLVGPPESARSDAWLDLAELIEADDRVCRKLVWLPPELDATSSATMFLRRTFLAKPWASATKGAARRLDQMSAIDLPPGWREVLENEALDPDAIVERIVEAHQ